MRWETELYWRGESLIYWLFQDLRHWQGLWWTSFSVCGRLWWGSTASKGIPVESFNCDETGLTTNPVHDKVYVRKGSKDAYMKAPNSGKTMFSVLFCVSATGVYLPPFTVYKSKNLYEFIWCLDDGGGSHDVVDWVLAADHNNGVDVKMLKEGISYVLAAYEGSYFPGLVTKLKKTSVEVSCLS